MGKDGSCEVSKGTFFSDKPFNSFIHVSSYVVLIDPGVVVPTEATIKNNQINKCE